MPVHFRRAFVLSLEKPLHHFPAGMACLDDDGAVYHR